ncbi:hypothetical protein ST37_01495 (plasmid) [Vibrio sp. qd031]|uniref:sulfurtransferase n=1 Tax=Vibrio sp. qd031 TaxID=1603038 RepID=UPI000A227756|nr:sulfurtransferase [Vibrio sp. qd031]ORT52480.1 hypothetical protein ST37_01495 [Vibrio sp. qd031]
MEHLVSTQWLAENISLPNLKILDASMEKVIGIDPIVYDRPLHIPNSIKMDLEHDFVADVEGVHPYPDASKVSSLLAAMGVKSTDTVIIYDNQGLYSAPRAWWILRSFGFKQVAILRGGLPKWIEESRQTTSTTAQCVTTSPENLTLDSTLLTKANEIHKNIINNEFLVVDVRGEQRFLGKVQEPRPGVRRGHIPGASNLPFSKLLDGRQLHSIEVLQQQFRQILDNSKQSQSTKLVFSCGSGVTACIAAFAAATAGLTNLSLYDGSWSEWGSDESLPIETSLKESK